MGDMVNAHQKRSIEIIRRLLDDYEQAFELKYQRHGEEEHARSSQTMFRSAALMVEHAQRLKEMARSRV